MKTILFNLAIVSVLLGGSALATPGRDSTFQCTIDKIQVTTWDLFQFDAGTQQIIRHLELTCDEETFGTNQHKAFLSAPLSLLGDLQSKKQNGIKSAYTMTREGYAGDLIAIDGKAVGPLQPDARPGVHFDYRREDQFNQNNLTTQIYLQNCKGCDGEVMFVARDSSQFRVISAAGRKRGSSNGDGRGTPGDMRAHLIVQGSVEAHQKPGDTLQLSARDSVGLSRFLLMKKFPASVHLSLAAVVCSNAENCSLIQEAAQ